MMRLFRKIEANTKGAGILTFNNQGSILANSGLYHGIMIWDFRTGTLLQQLDNRPDYLGAISFSSYRNLLVSATDDGAVTLWQYTDSVWKQKNKFEGEAGRIISVALHTDNDTILRLDAAARRLEIWSLRAEEILNEYGFGYATFHPNQPFIAMREHGYIVIVDYTTNTVIFKTHVGDNYSQIAFGNNGNSIATINDSGELVIVDLRTKSRKLLTRHGDYATKLVVPIDRGIACVLYESGTLGVWDTNEGIFKETTYTELYQPDGMAVSYRGDVLAIGGSAIDSGLIELWELDL